MKRKPTHRCEIETVMCRGKASQHITFTATKRKSWACLACLTVMLRNGMKFK